MLVIKNKMYQNISLIVDGTTVVLRPKAQVSLATSEITPQMEDLAKKDFIIINRK